jgi:hypothetical protein
VGGIQSQLSDGEDRWPLDRSAPRERPQAGAELGQREGLDDVVVGAAVEARDAIVDRPTRGEHKNRRPDTHLTQPAARLKPSMPGSITSSTITSYSRA